MKYYGEEPVRGRLRNHRSYSTASILDSIAHIAGKYCLDPMLLLDALSRAQMDEESRCEGLEVKCREVSKDAVIFLITCEDKVVWQFPIRKEILQEPELFKSHFSQSSPLAITRRERESTHRSISELKAKMKGITVRARVLEVPQKRLVNTKYGYEAYVSNVLIADETGAIRLSLWNNQIDEVSVGDIVNIEKASVTTFFGELQLRISRNGTISVESAQES